MNEVNLNNQLPITGNPYVGPQTFTAKQAHLFFGREQEARDLLSLVIINRVVLFFAQSGAGKSSLINTRLIPGLEERGFEVLPVARVGGGQPAQTVQPQNVYAHTLMSYLDDEPAWQATFAQRPLADLLPSLTWDGTVWRYMEEEETVLPTSFPEPAQGDEQEYEIKPRVLIIDQFEEILTSHPAAWAQRADFFDQLRDALEADPYLWLVLTMREDYVAALTPFIHLLPGQLRARYHMERMGVDAALLAVREPARIGGQAFESGVAEELVDNLRKIRMLSQKEKQLGQYLEPVQLQVVCYQLWENLRDDKMTGKPDDKMTGGQDEGVNNQSEHLVITQSDLARSGDVDSALTDFYEQALVSVLEDRRLPQPEPVEGVTQRQLRDWFSNQLIIGSQTRNTAYRNPETGETAGLPNAIVDRLASRFLLHTEVRAGGTWVELIHDRFVEPIQQANEAWRNSYNNPLYRAYQRWQNQGQQNPYLLNGASLDEAQRFADANPLDVREEEQVFLQRSYAYVREQELAVAQAEKTRRRNSWIAGTMIAVLLLFAGFAVYGLVQAGEQSERAARSAARAFAQSTSAARSEATAQAASTVAVAQARRAEYEEEQAKSAATRSSNEVQRAKSQKDERDRLSLAGDMAQQVLYLMEDGQNYGDLPLILARDAALTELTSNSYIALRMALRQPHWLNTIPPPQERHKGTVRSTVFHPDGKLVITGGDDGTIRVWDAIHLEPVRLLFGHTDSVLSIAVNPDGNRIISGSADGTVHVWDVNSGEQLARFNGRPGLVRAIAVSPDGEHIVYSSYDNIVRVWDIRRGEVKIVLNGHSEMISSVAVSPDGQYIISSSSDNSVRVWDMENGKQLALLNEHPGSVSAVAMSLDGERIISGSSDNIIRVWNVENGKQLAQLDGHLGWIYTVAMSPDGKRIVSGSADNTVRVWDMESGEQLIRLNGYSEPVPAVGLSLDGPHIPSDTSNSSIQFWDVQSSRQQASFNGHSGPVSAVAVSPDGEYIVSGSLDKTIRIWDMRSGEQIAQLNGHSGEVSNVAVTPDGKRIVSGSHDKTIRIWDMDIGKQLVQINGHSGPVTAIAIGQDGDSIISGSEDNIIRLWDVESGKQTAQFNGHNGTISALAVSPDGKRIVSGSHDSTIRVWDIESGEELTQMDRQRGKIFAVAVSSDGEHIFSGGQDRRIWSWDMEGGVSMRPFGSTRYRRSVSSLAVSPDGERIISGNYGGTIQIWSMKRKRELARFDEHSNRVSALAVSQDGKHIVSGSYDGTIRVWLDGPEHLIHKAIIQISRPAPILTTNERQRFDIGLDTLLPDQEILQPLMDEAEALQWIDKGYALARTGAISSAIASFEQALLLDSDLDFDPLVKAQQTLNRRVQALLLSGNNLANEGKLGDAIAKFEKIVKLDEMFDLAGLMVEAQTLAASIFVKQGRNLADEGDLIRALAKFEEAVNIDHTLLDRLVAQILVSLGKSLAQYGDIDASMVQLETAVSLDKTLNLDKLIVEAQILAASTAIEQGRKLADEGDLVRAITKFEEAVALDEALDIENLKVEARRLVISSLVEQGRNLAGEGDFEGAVAKFEEAKILDETQNLEVLRREAQALNAAALIRQSRSLVNQGDISDAIAKVEQAIDIAKTLKSVAMELALCRLQEFEPLNEAAAELCKRVSELTNPIAVGIPVTGTVIDPFGNLWALDIVEPSRVNINLNQTNNTPLDPYLTLYDSNFQLIAENDDIGDAFMLSLDAELFDLALTESGRYFIQASRCCPDDDGYTTGDYVLEVTVTEREEPVPVPATPTPVAPSPLALPTPHVVSPLATPTPHVVSPLGEAGSR